MVEFLFQKELVVNWNESWKRSLQLINLKHFVCLYFNLIFNEIFILKMAELADLHPC